MTKMNADIQMRPLRDEDREQLAVLYQNSFRRDSAMSQVWAKGTPLEHTVALFEKGRLVSSLVVHPYECFLGGETQALGGIGGVATGADSQGRGYARQIMIASLEKMKEQKQAVSTLYPFSFRFYRELGWGRSCRVQRYQNIRQDQLVRWQEGRLVRRIDPAGDVEALAAFHQEIMSYYNLTFTRSEEKWREFLNGLAAANTFLYGVFFDDELIGYFECQNHPIPKASVLGPTEFESLTRRMALRDETAIRAMVGFLARLPGHVKNIIVHAPVDIDLHDYMIEPSPLMMMEEQQFRIVMLKEAVERRGYAPDANGRLIVHISDAQCAWNEGTWCIDVEDGEAAVEKTQEEPMMSAPIDVFSQIFCGYKTASALAEHGDVEAWDEATFEICNEFFFDQPTFTQDWF